MSLYEDVPDQIMNDLQSTDDEKTSGIDLKSFLIQRCSKAHLKLTPDFMRTVLVLDGSHVKIKNPGRRKKSLSSKEKRKLKLYDINKECGRYEDYVMLNELWEDYFRGMIANTNKSLTEGDQALCTKLLKADYHGCILTVKRSKCPTYVGTTGILLQETRNVFKIITKSGLKTIPKQNSVFTFELDGDTYVIYGNNFRLKASERTVKKFKSKSTIDL